MRGRPTPASRIRERRRKEKREEGEEEEGRERRRHGARGHRQREPVGRESRPNSLSLCARTGVVVSAFTPLSFAPPAKTAQHAEAPTTRALDLVAKNRPKNLCKTQRDSAETKGHRYEEHDDDGAASFFFPSLFFSKSQQWQFFSYWVSPRRRKRASLFLFSFRRIIIILASKIAIEFGCPHLAVPRDSAPPLFRKKHASDNFRPPSIKIKRIERGYVSWASAGKKKKRFRRWSFRRSKKSVPFDANRTKSPPSSKEIDSPAETAATTHARKSPKRARRIVIG